MSKNILGGTYENLANYIFPRGCECPDDSGSCDWCHVYYGWFDREQMFALGMEKAALLVEKRLSNIDDASTMTGVAASVAKFIRDESWGQTKQSFGKSIQPSKLQEYAAQLAVCKKLGLDEEALLESNYSGEPYDAVITRRKGEVTHD